MERLTDIEEFALAVLDLANGQDKIFRLVERSQDFISRYRDGGCVRNASLHFNKSELSGIGYSRFNVVPAFVAAHIAGHITQSSFGLHYQFHSEKLDFLAILSRLSGACSRPIWL